MTDYEWQLEYLNWAKNWANGTKIRLQWAKDEPEQALVALRYLIRLLRCFAWALGSESEALNEITV